MNTRTIMAIVRKDLLTVRQNQGVWLPILLLPLILTIIMPTMIILIPSAVNTPGSAIQGMDVFMQHMPQALAQQVAGMNERQTFTLLFVMYFFAPFFLIIPIMVSSVIGADSFAGEKERKTLEALLYTPATDMELFIGKVLTALVPAVGISWLSFVLYSIVVNVAGHSLMGYIFFPNLMWFVLMLWVVPATAGFGLSVMVLVSSKVKTFQAAYQMGSSVVLPVLILVFAQISGVLYFSIPVVLLLGVVLWLIDAALIAFGVRIFARGELIARL
jgi:ABC-2 type transport system permease protein